MPYALCVNEVNIGGVMKKIVLLVVFCCTVVLLTAGCETVKGMGQDIENTGENVEKAMSK